MAGLIGTIHKGRPHRGGPKNRPILWTNWEGLKNPKNFADFLHEWSLRWPKGKEGEDVDGTDHVHVLVSPLKNTKKKQQIL